MKALCISFLCFGVFVLYSCKKEIEYIISLEKVTVNKTDKDLMITVFTETGTDSMDLSGGDSLSIVFEKKKVINNYWYMHIGLHLDPVCVIQEILYNLTDTTRFTYPVKYCVEGFDGLPGYSNEKEKEYAERLTYIGTGTGIAPCNLVILKIDEALLDSIMEKDYTMLDRFKDYYNR